VREDFEGYALEAHCARRPDGRYAVGVTIEREVDGKPLRHLFEDPGVSFILQVEAELEALSLGRKLVRRGSAGF